MGAPNSLGKQFPNSDFGDLAHGIARKLIDAEVRKRHLRRSQSLLAPCTKLCVGWPIGRIGQPCDRHALAPLVIGQTDNGAISDRWMGAKYFLDFEGRNLLATGLDDVDRCSTEEAVAIGRLLRNVSGAEPTINK